MRAGSFVNLREVGEAADGYSGYRAGRLVGAVERRIDTLWRLGSAKSRWSGRWRIRHGLSLVASASLIALTSVWVLPGASGATSPESASNHSGTSMFYRDADAIGDTPASDPAIVTRNVLARVTPPRRDEVALSRRYRGACTDPLPAPVALSRTAEAGEHRRFWVLDEGRRTFFQANATLAGQSEHLLLYVQDGVPVAPGAIDETIRQFEEKSLPLLARVFGALPPEREYRSSTDAFRAWEDTSRPATLFRSSRTHIPTNVSWST